MVKYIKSAKKNKTVEEYRICLIKKERIWKRRVFTSLNDITQRGLGTYQRFNEVKRCRGEIQVLNKENKWEKISEELLTKIKEQWKERRQ